MSQQWFFDWDNASVHTDAVVSSWFDAHGVPARARALFACPGADRLCVIKKTKWGLAGQSLDQDSFKNAWEGVARPLISVAFAAAFRSFEERCKKRVRLGGKFVEKS